MHEEYCLVQIRGRNSNTQLFMSFGNKLIFI